MAGIDRREQEIIDFEEAKQMPLEEGVKFLVERGWPEYEARRAIRRRPSAINVDKPSAESGLDLTEAEQEELSGLVLAAKQRDLTLGERRLYCELHGFGEAATEYIIANGFPR